MSPTFRALIGLGVPCLLVAFILFLTFLQSALSKRQWEDRGKYVTKTVFRPRFHYRAVFGLALAVLVVVGLVDVFVWGGEVPIVAYALLASMVLWGELNTAFSRVVFAGNEVTCRSGLLFSRVPYEGIGRVEVTAKGIIVYARGSGDRLMVISPEFEMLPLIAVKLERMAEKNTKDTRMTGPRGFSTEKSTM